MIINPKIEASHEHRLFLFKCHSICRKNFENIIGVITPVLATVCAFGLILLSGSLYNDIVNISPFLLICKLISICVNEVRGLLYPGGDNYRILFVSRDFSNSKKLRHHMAKTFYRRNFIFFSAYLALNRLGAREREYSRKFGFPTGQKIIVPNAKDWCRWGKTKHCVLIYIL